MWVYTKQKEIIVGIEEPWKYPEAFIDINNKKEVKAFNELIPSMKKSSLLGHPSLSTSFDPKGNAENSKGMAYIGGELKYVNGKWQIDNISGRFGSFHDGKAIEMQQAILEVAANFGKCMSSKAPPKVCLYLQSAPYLKNYYQIWNKGVDSTHAAFKLLKSYTGENNVVTGFLAEFHRNHLDLVKETLASFKNQKSVTPEKILAHFAEKLSSVEISPKSSLMQRLNFISIQTTGQEFKLSPKPDKNSTPSI